MYIGLGRLFFMFFGRESYTLKTQCNYIGNISFMGFEKLLKSINVIDITGNNIVGILF